MLTSSDAKWRCMWHMMVWSMLLTVVSQFLVITEHVAFWIFSLLSLLLLPILTAVYSNTSGRHGAGLIRVAYVICDPVLACISISPVLILNHLSETVTSYSCMVQSESWNQTCSCILNRTSRFEPKGCHHGKAIHTTDKDRMATDIQERFVVIQISVAVPVLISLLMGRRTNKMSFSTYLLTFAYWFVIAIESVDLLDTIRLGDIYRHVIYTTMSIIAISIIITNSYALVTLCSFISPQAGSGRKQVHEQFDFIYRTLVGGSGVLFMETPLLVARFQILASDLSKILPAAFYLWLIKDFIFIFLIVAIICTQKVNNKYVARLPCRVNFDNPDVMFKPEKRDEYIAQQKHVRFSDPPATTFGEYCDDPVMRKHSQSANISSIISKRPSAIAKNDPSFALNNNSTDFKQKAGQPSGSILKGARPKVYNTQHDYLPEPDLDTSSDSSIEAVL
ncbi:hypothetical protein LSH36_55g04030 [Paralvinella palmiformis]|uniref:Uncharacterized protein n=1 Tax=Paralvinella palmiformis TaxID=53620 RepID=A0AAD9K615_9ANNE|nr:hypothetical protein LSH36_55g04030 [Paralvinella palmiformis]